MTIKTSMTKGRRLGFQLACLLFLINITAAQAVNIDSLKALAQTAPFPDRIEHLITWYSETSELFRQPEIAMIQAGVDWLESLPQMTSKQQTTWSNLKLMLANMYADNEELENLFNAASEVIILADSLGRGEENWLILKGQAYFYLSLVAGLEDKPDVKISQLEKAYQCFEQIGHKTLMAQAFGSMSAAQSESGKPELAFETSERASKLYQEIDDEYGYLRMSHYQVGYLIEMQRWEKAKALLDEIIPRMKETQHVSYNISVANLGEVYLKQKNYGAAEPNLLEALNLAKERQVNTTIAYVYENLVALEEAKGNYQQALAHQKEHARYADSISVQSRDKGLKDAQAKFEHAESQQKIKELESKISQQERSAFVKMGLLAFGLLAAAGVVSWFFHQKKKKEVAAAARTLTVHLQPANPTSEEPQDHILHQFLGIVQAQLGDENLTVEGIAQTLRMSRVSLFKKVKTATGASPSEIIRQYRLEAGKQLLLENPLTVSEVAYRVGFGNPNSFSRAFKDKFGGSPSDFLLKNKAN